MVLKNRFGFICNFVPFNGSNFYIIRRELKQKYGCNIELISNLDSYFTEIFGKNYSNTWFVSFEIKDNFSLESFNSLLKYFSRIGLEPICVVNEDRLSTVKYCKDHIQLFNNENWGNWNVILILLILVKFVNLTQMGNLTLLKLLMYKSLEEKEELK